MAILTFDTLAFSKTMQDAGMERMQAEALATAQREAFSQMLDAPDFATKADVLETRAALKEDIVAVRTALKKDIVAVRTELKEDIVAVRTALKKDIVAVRTELKEDIAAVRTELKEDIAAVRNDLKEEIAKSNARIDVLEQRMSADMNVVKKLLEQQDAKIEMCTTDTENKWLFWRKVLIFARPPCLYGRWTIYQQNKTSRVTAHLCCIGSIPFAKRAKQIGQVAHRQSCGTDDTSLCVTFLPTRLSRSRQARSLHKRSAS